MLKGQRRLKTKWGKIFSIRFYRIFYLWLYLFISIAVSASPGDKVKDFYQNKNNAQRHTNI